MSARPAAKGFLPSAFALLAALLVAVLLLLLASGDPGATLDAFFMGPFSGIYAFGNMISRAALFALVGVGSALAFRGGAFNLGGEGQVYAGGLAAALAGAALAGAGGAAALGGALFAGVIAGGALGSLSGWLKRAWGVDELITSFLVANAVTPLIDHAISGPLRDPAGSLIATAPLPADALLASFLPPSNLGPGLLIAAVAALLGWVFIEKSRPGFAYRLCGRNPRFAAAGGLSPRNAAFLGMAVSGALAGLAGAVAVLEPGQGTCYRGFSAGMGWNGIAVALVARNSPLAALPAALVFAFIDQGSAMAMLRGDFGFALGSVVQAVVFLLITARAGFLGKAALGLGALLARVRGGRG